MLNLRLLSLWKEKINLDDGVAGACVSVACGASQWLVARLGCPGDQNQAVGRHGSLTSFSLPLPPAKKKNKKGKTLTLTDFLAEDGGGGGGPTYIPKPVSWADETDDLEGDGTVLSWLAGAPQSVKHPKSSFDIKSPIREVSWPAVPWG